MAQPISDRVDRDGHRRALRRGGQGVRRRPRPAQKADEIARVAAGVAGATDIRVERITGPAIPVGRDRPRRDRPPRPQRVGRERRDRGGHRRQKATGYSRASAASPRWCACRRASATTSRRSATCWWNPGGVQVALENLANIRIVDGPAQISRKGQAPRGGGDQREGPRPGRLRGRAAEDHRRQVELPGRAITSSGAASSRTWSGRWAT